MHRRSVFLTTLASGLAVVPAASASWSAPTQLTTPTAPLSSTAVAVGIDNAGTATAVWAQSSNVGSTPFALSAYTHQIGRTYAGVSLWSAGKVVSGTLPVATQTDSVGNWRVALGVGPAGNAVAAFTRAASDASQSELWATTRASNDADWTTPVSLTNGTEAPGVTCVDKTVKPSPPTISISPLGNGHIGWFGTCPGNSSSTPLLARAFSVGGLEPTAHVISTAAASTESGSTIQPPFAESLDGGSTATVFSHDLNPPGAGAVASTFASSGATPVATPTYLNHTASSQQLSNLRIAAIPGGFVAAWLDNGVIYTSVNGGPATVVPTPNQSPRNLRLAAGADGTAVIGWQNIQYSDDGLTLLSAIWAAVRSPAGTIGAPNPGGFGPAHQLITGDGEPHGLQLAVAANGVGYAVWSRDTGEYDGIEGSLLDPKDPNRSPGTPWQFQPTAETIINGGFITNQAGDAQTPALAVDAKGNAEVLAPVFVPGGATRYAIAQSESLSPRPADGADGATTPAAGGDTAAPAQPSPDAGPPSGPAPAGPGSGPGAAPTPKPAPLVISGYLITRNYFGVGSKAGKKLSGSGETLATGRKAAKGLRVGTEVEFTLSRAAPVTLTVSFTGCYDTGLSPKAKGIKACNRTSTTGGTVYTKTIAGKAGRNTFNFTGTGLLKGKHLIVGGEYAMHLTAKDPATGAVVVPNKNDPPARIDAAL